MCLLFLEWLMQFWYLNVSWINIPILQSFLIFNLLNSKYSPCVSRQIFKYYLSMDYPNMIYKRLLLYESIFFLFWNLSYDYKLSTFSLKIFSDSFCLLCHKLTRRLFKNQQKILFPFRSLRRYSVWWGCVPRHILIECS